MREESSKLAYLQKLRPWFNRRTPRVLMLLALVVGGLWLFVELAGEVSEGDTQAFDEWLLKSLRRADDLHRPVGPHWIVEVGRDLTALGGVAVLSLVTLVVAGFLFLHGKIRTMLFLLLSTDLGLVLTLALKSYFRRPRPELVPHLAEVYTASFPSGHAMLSAIVYLTLGALLVPLLERRVLKIYVLTVAILLTALVGLSRIYVGVHYPTDVLAGWTAGLVWATLSWLIFRWLQSRGQAETEPLDRPPAKSDGA